MGMASTAHSTSSKMSSSTRTLQVESQKKVSSVKAAPEASSSRTNVIRTGATKLQIKRSTTTQAAPASRLSSQVKSSVASVAAVVEEKETYVELPDIDSE